MNKSVFLLFFISLVATAPGAGATEVRVDFQGHHGLGRQYRMQITPQEITLNGISISSHVTPALGPELSALLRPRKDGGGNCGAGEYVHFVKSKKLNRQASGCLGSATANRLLSSLRKIESLSYLRRLPASHH